MPVTRRDFLRLTVGGGLLLVSAYLFKEIFRPAQLSAGEQRTLDALVDSLIPEDETPGALRLGVPQAIKLKAAADSRYRYLIKRGCAWLDMTARGQNAESFESLKAEGRDAIIGKAINSEVESLPKIYLYQMRNDAFHYYYGHRESWAVLGYDGPPQPCGFPDYYLAPPHST
ncbi:MAG: gluconate 2-dehydrogenase subunit 3 family protein [Candidatus Magnetominusculus sp. LBB02]|nr:gluconate 2-dehydrogenase subunit 3 family protein [Candidatus Magnetominusculus sp. LBB02]